MSKDKLGALMDKLSLISMLLFMLFLVLERFKVIDWSWYLVSSPLFFNFTITLFSIFVTIRKETNKREN